MRIALIFSRSKLGLVEAVSQGFFAVAIFFAASGTLIVAQCALYSAPVFMAIYKCAKLCGKASNGAIILLLNIVLMLLAPGELYAGIKFSLYFHQTALSVEEMENIEHISQELTRIITGYAYFPAIFCLPTKAAPLPPLSKQEVLRRGAIIVLIFYAVAVVLPIFSIII